LIFGLFCAKDWATAGSQTLRAELTDAHLVSVRGTVAHYQCMGDAMLVQLPATRTRIRIDVEGEWMQRLTESAYLRHDIVVDVADADYVVTLGTEAGECGAAKVLVTPAP
jgi:hypothetical protein